MSTTAPRYVVMFSGGAGSWGAAKRTVELAGGPDDVVLLFADTRREDADLYRFVQEAAADVGAPLVIVRDGRTPFEVFHDKRWIGNSRVAQCSTELKVEPARAWLFPKDVDPATLDPATLATVVVGIDWTEIHRLPAIEKGWAPFPVIAPLTERPYVEKRDLLADLEAAGVRPPRAYAEGFEHNNCLEQGCIRGGKGYWQHLLRRRREVYLRTEAEELELREHLGTDATILTETVNREERRLTLRELRERTDAQPELFDDKLELEACGCFTETEAPA